MLLGISQPTFMPWIGYFAFLDKIDNLVFLDSVQFEKEVGNKEIILDLIIKNIC